MKELAKIYTYVHICIFKSMWAGNIYIYEETVEFIWKCK